MFADHADLLKEFTYFLPDAVQEQAKERLSRAVQESEIRRERATMGTACMKHPQMTATDEGVSSSSSRIHKVGGTERSRRGAILRETKSPCSPSKASTVRNATQIVRKTIPANQGTSKSSPHMSNPRFLAGCNDSRADEMASTRFGVTSNTITCGLQSSSARTLEHQFFEQARETFASPTPDTWREFLRCIDLFSQGLLRNNEMLNLVSDLFGRRTNLFEEFQRIVSLHDSDATARATMNTDAFVPSMPFNEHDMSRCLRCTPSYRCLSDSAGVSMRLECTPSCHACLNNKCMSQPVGSEQAFSFKHTRKNQYEDALFRSEDEHFELDVVIDANCSTIRALEALQEEVADSDEGVESSVFTQYSLDHKLSSVHANAVCRLYGSHSQEVIEILNLSPSTAIPVILRRLKEKDVEWRKAKDDLIQHWKDVLRLNSSRSLDHRSFYFKQHEKRTIKPRHLISDLVSLADRSRNGGGSWVRAVDTPLTNQPRLRNVPLIQQRSSVAAHATDGGLSLETGVDTDTVSDALDLCVRSVHVHKVIVNTLRCATEHSSLSVDEKLKVNNFYDSFVRVFFALHAHVSSSDLGCNEIHGAVASPHEAVTAHQARAESDGMQSSRSEVHSMDRVDQLLKVIDMPPSSSSSSSHQFPRSSCLHSLRGEPDLALNTKMDPWSSVEPFLACPFIGTQNVCVFFRLYYIFITRIELAVDLCLSCASVSTASSRVSWDDRPSRSGLHGAPANHTNKQWTVMRSSHECGVAVFEAFLSSLHGVLDGSIESQLYEDSCRNLMGNQAYPLFSLDRLIVQIMKVVQLLVHDTVFSKTHEAWSLHRAGSSSLHTINIGVRHDAGVVSNRLKQDVEPVPLLTRVQDLMISLDCQQCELFSIQVRS